MKNENTWPHWNRLISARCDHELAMISPFRANINFRHLVRHTHLAQNSTVKPPGSCIALLLSMMLAACSRQKQPITPVASPPPRAAMPASALATTTPARLEEVATQVPVASGAYPAQSPSTLVASDVTQGPFTVGDQTFTFVKHVLKIEGAKPADESTVDWWELRDADGKAIVHQQNPPAHVQNGAFEDTEDVSASELKTTLGRGLLLSGAGEPSAPNEGWWVQVYGLLNNKLTAMGPPVSAEGDFLGEAVDSYQPTAMIRGQQLQMVTRDVLNFRVWTGNFNITYSVLIDWIQGALRPAWTCSRTGSKGPVSACRYKVQADRVRTAEMTFVRLFPEPDDDFTAKHLVVKPDSTIEYIEAEVPMSWSSDPNHIGFGVQDMTKMWLHIKIDGQDGWISGEEDFEAVGLPQAG